MKETEKGRRGQRVKAFYMFKTKELEFLQILLKYARRHENKQPQPLLVLTRWPLLLTTLLYHSITHQN